MQQRHDHLDQPPRREELAAYFDQELTGHRRRQLEAWLADHPEAQADLEEWRQLRELTRATRADEPCWAGVCQRIDAATLAYYRSQARRMWARRLLTGAAAVAASLLMVLWLNGPKPVVEEPAEPLVVARPADVEIMSMNAADLPALVVGEPPLREPLVLAEPADINVEHIEPASDGMVPSVRLWSETEVPMIVATLVER